MLLIIIIILFLILLFAYYNLYKNQETIQSLNEGVAKRNQILYDKCQELIKELHDLETSKANSLIALQEVSQEIELEKSKLDFLKRDGEDSLRHGYEMYVEVLSKSYEDAERKHDEAIEKLSQELKEEKGKYEELISKEADLLQQLVSSRKAVIEANLREREIEEKLDFYCLSPKTTDIADIKTLERVKAELHNPRILSMLIWSTYFQKDMTSLCNNVLGTDTVTGIYKITNQENKMCYIGQSVDVSKRWKDHAKCGLGIDAPQGNKLYKDMQAYGIWNFSWELLEKCPKEELNAKERYYIELYQSKDYGYNTVKGNK